MRKKPYRIWDTTFLTLGANGFEVTLNVRSWFPPSFRRQIALSFFKSVRPWIEYMRTFQLTHTDWTIDFNKDTARGIYDDDQVGFDDPNYRTGFRLRIARHVHEYTLKQVSAASGVRPSHISAIERGLVKPREKTLNRLYAALQLDLPLRKWPKPAPRYRRKKWHRSE